MQQVGQAQPASQVQGGLHGLPDAGHRLVHPEQFDRQGMRAPTEFGLQRHQLDPQRRLGRGCRPDLQGGPEGRPGVDAHQLGEHRLGPAGPGRQVHRGRQFRHPALADVVHDRLEQQLPGREVVLRGAPGHPGPGRHQGYRGRGPADLGERVHGGVQQPAPGQPAAILLRLPLDHVGRLADHREHVTGPDLAADRCWQFARSRRLPGRAPDVPSSSPRSRSAAGRPGPSPTATASRTTAPGIGASNEPAGSCSAGSANRGSGVKATGPSGEST